MQQFGEEFKKARQRCFLSQESLSNLLGVSVSTVNRWESGESTPNLSAMKQIKKFCLENNIKYETLESLWLEEKASK